MSERPDGDTGSMKTDPPIKLGEPPAPPTSTPKPEPAKQEPAKEEPKQPEPAKPQSKVSGETTFDDGYWMRRFEDGEFALTNTEGDTAWWDPNQKTWTHVDGTPMPAGWDNGHAPFTQSFTSGPSSPATKP